MKFVDRVPKVIAVLGILSIALTGCGQPTDAIIPSGDSGAGGTASPSPTETPKVFVAAPLTGVVYEEGSNPNLAGPSVACKIDNAAEARPQINLNKADLVYDEMVEGGLTRLVAVWHSQLPDTVGPVRSIRPMDPDIISPHGGIVCYSGGQQIFVDMMRNTNVFNATETTEQGNDTFKRVSDRYAPHNVVVDAAKLASQHLDLAPPQAQFEFALESASASAHLASDVVKRVIVPFPSASAEWVWSDAKNAWLRVQDGVKHKDAATGDQISAQNIVVLKVVIDRTYGYVPKTVMVDEGKAWIFSGGGVVEATWKKSGREQPIELFGIGGSKILLAPGNTWIELMPNTSKLNIVRPKPVAPSESASASSSG